MSPDTRAAIIADLVKALEPFAALAHRMPLSDRTRTLTLPAHYFRQARAALARAKQLDLDRARIVELGRHSPRKTENLP